MCGGKAANIFSLHALALRDKVKMYSAASLRFCSFSYPYSQPFTPNRGV